MSKLKLLKVNELEDGTIRLQSQLMVGRDSVDFILKDNVLKCWGNGDKGHNFYEYNKPYEIVSNKSDMVRQCL